MTLVFLVVVAIAGPASMAADFRPVPPGTVAAVVLDSQNMKPIPGATATLVSARGGKNRVLVTGPEGRVEFRDLSSGTYTLNVAITGFATTCIGPFHVRSGEHENPQLPEFRVVINPVAWVDYVTISPAGSAVPPN